MKQQLKKEIKEWVDTVGKRKAILTLINNGIAPSTAHQIVTLKYGSDPRELFLKILKDAIAEIKKVT